MSNFKKLDLFFIFLSIIFGALILFFPIQKLLIMFLGVIFLTLLVAKPKYCFYLMLLLSTYVFPFETEARQLPFNQTDILISLCFIGALVRILFLDQRFNPKTRIDKWIIILLILYFLAGFTSISHRGYQGFLKFGETVTVFYLSIYFIRTKEIKISNLIRFILFIGIFQASYGILQSLTGSFGANFQSERGLLGYIGLGSKLVWHGRGTFAHFNHFGPFLSMIFLFFLPINHFLVKNKKKGYMILLILLTGVIISYSRASLLGLVAGIIFFLFQIKKNKLKFLSILVSVLLVALGLYNFLKNTSYITTLAPRNDIWEVVFTAITSSTRTLLFGTGLKSYTDAVWVYLPGNILPSSYNDFQAHNFCLHYIVEIGIIGSIIVLSFLIYTIVAAYSNFKTNTKLAKVLSSSTSIVIVCFFFEGLFDTAFNLFTIQIWLFLILGLMYSKVPIINKVKR
ncbi:MAG: hypothetical protein A2255_00500 [Candidatus Melainabacteria bacterium RIFOXYA2_FULL_32_9]|nr:MAG: hypothetical protein A2255_00500 [Candidatus Melainabacteria bacterium RIFOXYA2_FULL_32_9]